MLVKGKACGRKYKRTMKGTKCCEKHAIAIWWMAQAALMGEMVERDWWKRMCGEA